jgi:flagellar protein FliL
MIRKLIPVLLAILGLAAGGGAGIFLRPAAESHVAESHGAENAGGEAGTGEHAASDPAATTEQGHATVEDGHGAAEPADKEASDGEHPENAPEYVKLNNQFVIPVVEDGAVAAMVILSLSLEVTTGSTEAVYNREPKLRDVFLQVLFDHANAGGFSGTFTDGANLVLLRQALLEIARRTMGDMVKDVLIVDIARQDT